MDNESVVRKTIETSDFIGNVGLLNAKQQAEYVRLVRTNSVLLNMMTLHKMTQRVEDIDKLNLGEPITEVATENTQAATTVAPKFDKVTLSTTKMRSKMQISYEVLKDAIEKNRFEQTMMEVVTKKVGSDLEKLAIRGDTTINATLTDANSKLLRALNGLQKQTDSAHIVDATNTAVDHALLAQMLDALPDEYHSDPDIRFMMSRKTEMDYRLSLQTNRKTPLGDIAISDRGQINAYGVPIISVPLIPNNLDVDISAATAATGVGLTQDPFTVVASGSDQNNDFRLTVTTLGATATFSTTLATGVQRVGAIADSINTAFRAAHANWALEYIAFDNGEGRLYLKSPDKNGSASITVVVDNAVRTAAAKLLGFYNEATNAARGPFTGAAANAAGTIPDGTFIWLGNPANFVFGILDQTRVFTEYNKDFDRLEVVVYNSVDFKVQNLDAVVKAVNVVRSTV